MPRRWSRAAFPLAAIGLLALVVASCSPAPAAPTKSGPAPGAGPAAAAGATAASGTAPQPQVQQLPPIRVAYVAPVASMMPLWLAKESGAFERAGVPVEVKLIQSNAAVAALIAGEVDLLQLSAPPVVTAGVQDADLVFIAGALNNMIHSAHVQAQLSSAEALKGMLWGSDRPGTPNDFATVVAIDKLGLKASDLQIINIGTSDQLLAALLSGQLAATVLGPPHNFVAEDAGYPMLVDTYDVAYQTIGIAGLRSRLVELEPALVPFLRAYREGIERYDGDKAFAMKVLEDYTQTSDPRIVERTYEFFKTRGWNRSLTVSEAGVQNVIDFVARSVPAAQGVSAERFIERRYVEQLGPP